jgi:hypothetical protein
METTTSVEVVAAAVPKKTERELELERQLAKLEKKMKKIKKRHRRHKKTPHKSEQQKAGSDEEEEEEEEEGEEEEEEQQKASSDDEPEKEEEKTPAEKKQTHRQLSKRDEELLVQLAYRSMFIGQAENYPPSADFDFRSLLPDDDDDHKKPSGKSKRRRKHNDEEEDEEEDASSVFTEEESSLEEEEIEDDDDDDSDEREEEEEEDDDDVIMLEGDNKKRKVTPPTATRVLPARSSRHQATEKIGEALDRIRQERALASKSNNNNNIGGQTTKMDAEARAKALRQSQMAAIAKQLQLGLNGGANRQTPEKVLTGTPKEAWRDPLQAAQRPPGVKTPLPPPSSTGKKSIVAEFQRHTSRGDDGFDFEQHSSDSEEKRRLKASAAADSPRPTLVVHDQQRIGVSSKKQQASKKISAYTESLVTNDSARQQQIVYPEPTKTSLQLKTEQYVQGLEDLAKKLRQLGKRGSSEMDLTTAFVDEPAAKRRRLDLNGSSSRGSAASPDCSMNGDTSSNSNSLTMTLEEKMRCELRYIVGTLDTKNWREREQRLDKEIAEMNKAGVSLRREHKDHQIMQYVHALFQKEKLGCIEVVRTSFKGGEEAVYFENMLELIRSVTGFSKFTILDRLGLNQTDASVGAAAASRPKASNEITCRITNSNVQLSQACKCVFEFPGNSRPKKEFYIGNEWRSQMAPLVTLIHHQTIVKNALASSPSSAVPSSPDSITDEFVSQQVKRIRNSFLYFHNWLRNAGKEQQQQALASILAFSGWLLPTTDSSQQ